MRWDPIAYLIHRTDRLERDNHALRLQIQQVDTRASTAFGGLAKRIESIELWMTSIKRTTRKWPLAIVILALGVAANVAPEATAGFLAIALKAVL